MAPTVEEPVKRGRGRPRKTDAEKAATAAAKVGKSGRPRGRPLGSKNKKTGTIDSGVTKSTAPAKRATHTSAVAAAAAAAVAAAEKEDQPAPVARGRGRPRKVVAEEEDAPVAKKTPKKAAPKAKAAVATPGTGEKRGRGRPRKIQTPALVAQTPASVASEPKRRGRPPKSATPKGSATPVPDRGASPVLGGEEAENFAAEEDQEMGEGEKKDEPDAGVGATEGEVKTVITSADKAEAPASDRYSSPISEDEQDEPNGENGGF
ncbi:hypothetical protein B0T11DRAFT_281852 [Plectosphaerella cucumerina]|uniref:AT hook domain-containing protein n=1 Tax=Plectosphaerella cucumerina TaxID=40658 RepID=A0A8K0X491_9PEZI|nr:hypothetical protein B0T11DRAFT_281852 [Plectosphaerella cucumerina]